MKKSVIRKIAQRQNKEGLFIPLIITGESGVGKNTLIQKVQEFLCKNNIPLNIDHGARATTRQLRQGELHNDRLIITPKEEFLKKIKSREFFYHYENWKGTMYGFDKELLIEDLKKTNIALYIARGNQVFPFFKELYHQRKSMGVLPPLVLLVRANASTILQRLKKRPATEGEKKEKRYQLEHRYGLETSAIQKASPLFRVAIKEIWFDTPEESELAAEIVTERLCDHIEHCLRNNKP